MAGLHPASFSAWADSTSQVLLSGKDAFINVVQKNNYGLLSRMWQGTDLSRILRGGQYIEEQIMNTVTRRSQTYLPGEPLSYLQSNPGIKLQYGWRFHMHHLAWQEELVVLQGTSDMTEDARMIVWKTYLKKLHAEFWQEVSDYYEELFFSKPSLDSEGITGRNSATLPMFINERDNGLFTDDTVTMTTVGGKSTVAATTPNWMVQRFAYKNFTAGNADGWIKAMRKCKRLINYKASPIHSEHSTPVGFGATDTVILASEWGARSVEEMYLAAQDRWVNQSDPYGAVFFDGIPLQYIAYKDAATVYPGATATTASATEQGADITGPRFEVVNTTHTFLCMHKDRVLKDLGVQNDSRTPTSKAQPYNTFAQLVCNNLRANAIIYPTQDITYT